MMRNTATALDRLADLEERVEAIAASLEVLRQDVGELFARLNGAPFRRPQDDR